MWGSASPSSKTLSSLNFFQDFVAMEEANPEIVPEQPPNPIVSLIQNFRLPFPADRQFELGKPADSGGDSANETDFVKFTDPIPVVPPPLKFESEESAQSGALVWQVCALGGYLLTRWIWGKWKEKRSKDQPSDESKSPPSN